jgi:hypothetical protein
MMAGSALCPVLCMKKIFLKTSRGFFILADKIRPAKNSQSNLVYNAIFFLCSYINLVYAWLQGHRQTFKFPVWNNIRFIFAIYLYLY